MSLSSSHGVTFAVVVAAAICLQPASGWSGEAGWDADNTSACATTLPQPQLQSVRPPPDPSGTWAQRVELTGVSRVPIVGQITSVTTTLQLVQIDTRGQSSSDIQMTTEVCEIDLQNNSSMVHPRIPKAFAQSLGKTVRDGNLVQRTDGWWLQMDRHTQVIGASLRHPPEESLPTRPDDPRVYDQDGDGKPGMTVQVRGTVRGELYLVQRGMDAWNARFQTRDDMKGCVDWSQTQKVVDSNSMLLGDGPATRQHPQVGRSTVTLRRLNEMNATCEDVQQAFG
jgi:hypothetical protein